ncbi:MAG: hypothetical protein WA004_20100 [Saprospiraceae bacterium]
MRILLITLVLAVIFQGCGQDKPTQQPPPATSAAQPASATLPSIPKEKLEFLWNNCDNIDYVFYELPISMNVDNPDAIKNALTHVASEPAPMLPQCKAIGRVFYLVKGENVVIADMYFSEGCTYYVFLENDKPVYANYLTPQAVQYFNSVFSQSGVRPEQLK